MGDHLVCREKREGTSRRRLNIKGENYRKMIASQLFFIDWGRGGGHNNVTKHYRGSDKCNYDSQDSLTPSSPSGDK